MVDNQGSYTSTVSIERLPLIGRKSRVLQFHGAYWGTAFEYVCTSWNKLWNKKQHQYQLKEYFGELQINHLSSLRTSSFSVRLNLFELELPPLPAVDKKSLINKELTQNLFGRVVDEKIFMATFRFWSLLRSQTNGSHGIYPVGKRMCGHLFIVCQAGKRVRSKGRTRAFHCTKTNKRTGTRLKANGFIKIFWLLSYQRI